MADIQSNIRIDVDTSGALAAIRNLQSQISQFQTSMNRGTAAQAAAASKLSQQLVSGINASGKFAASITSVQTSAESFTGALEKNKLSFGEYFRYSAASTKSFGRFFKGELNVIEKTARERVKTLQTQYVKLGRDASGAMKAVAVRPLALDMDNLGTKTAIAAQKQQILNQLLRQGSTNLLNFGKNTQWAGRQLMVGFTIPLGIFGAMAGRTFMELEEQVINFKKVYGDLFTTDQEAEQALDNIKELADGFTQYGVAVSETIGLAADAAAAGFGGADLINQTNAAIKISVLGQLDQQKALETTIALQNAFKLSSTDLADAINFLNAVENQTVVALDDITTAIPKVAPVIQALGGDVRDLAFFLSAMKEGGVNASEGANALKSSLGRLINPTKVAREMFQGLGIDLVDIVDRNAGNVRQTVLDLGMALDTLDPLNRSRAIEQLFGKFQFARMSTLFENINKDGTQAARVLDLASYSAADLARISEEELGVSAASAMNQFRGAIERLQAALAPVGELFLQIATPLVDFATNVIDKFNNLDEGTKRFVAGLTAMLGVVGPVALMTFGLLANGVANIMKGFLAVRKAFQNTGKQSQILGQQTEYLTQQQLEEMAVAASLETSQNRLTQSFTSQTAAVNRLIAAYEKAIQRQKQFGGMGISTSIGGGPRGGTRAYKSGAVSVPGSGFGDKVPAMLEPGEAVIPRKEAQKYSDVIKAMVAGNIPGFRFGFNPMSFMMNRSRVATRMSSQSFMNSLRSRDLSYKSGFATGTGADFTDRMGRPMKQHQLMRRQAENKLYGVPVGKNDPSMRPTYGSVATSPLQRILNLLFGRKGRQFNQVTNPMASNLDQYGDISLIGKRSMNRRASSFVGDTLLKYSKNPAWVRGTAPMRGASAEQMKTAGFSAFDTPFGSRKTAGGGVSQNPAPSYIEAQTMGGFRYSEVQKIIAKDPAVKKQLQQELRAAGLGNIRVSSPNFLSKLMQSMGVPGFQNGLVPGFGKGDKFPALLEPGEAVIPSDVTRTYAPVIDGMIAGNLPGFQEGRRPGGALTSPGGKQLQVGNLNSLRAIERLVGDLQGADELLDQAFEQLANSVKVTKDEFVNKVKALAQESGTKLPGSFSTERRYSASKFGEKRNLRQQLSEERGAEGVKEYEQQLTLAKQLRTELEAINQEKIEAGQNPVFSEAEIKDLTQIDRAHILDVDKSVGKAAWSSELFQAEVGAQNRFAGSVSRSPRNKQMLQSTMQEMGMQQTEIDNLMDKYTKGLSLTEKEQETQAKVLKRMLQKLNSNADLAKQVSPAFAKQATAVTKIADMKAADPTLKRAAERSVKKANEFYQKALIDATNQAGQMRSPSQRTRKQGENLVEGLEQGIVSGQDDMKAAGQKLASSAAQEIFKMPAGRRATTSQNTFLAGQRQAMMGADASRMGLVGTSAKGGQAFDVQNRKMVQGSRSVGQSLQGLNSGIMQASFAFSSISMLAGGLGGELGGLSQAVFGISNVMFALSAILPLVTAGFAKLSTQLATQNFTQMLSSGFGKISGIFTRLAPMLLKFVPFLGAAITAFGAIKVIGDIQEKQKQKIEGMGDAAFAAGEKLKNISGIIGFDPTRDVDRSGQLNQVRGLETGGAARAQGIQQSEEFQRLAETSVDEGGFREDIENIKKASLEDAEAALNSLVIQLMALAPEGTDPARIQEFVAAIAAEAGKTQVDLSLGVQFDPFKPETFKKIADQSKTIANNVRQNFEEELAEIENFTFVSGAGLETGSLSQIEGNISDELRASAETLGAQYSSLFEQLQTGLQAGTISATEYRTQTSALLSDIQSLGPAVSRLTLDEAFENIGLPDISEDIKNVESQSLILQASLAGVNITEPQLEAIAAGEKLNATAVDQAAAQNVLNTLMFQYETKTGEAAKSVEELKEEERKRNIELSTGEIDDQITANEEMLDLYPDLVEALGSEEEALKAVSDEKTRKLVLDAIEQDKLVEGTPNYDAVTQGLNNMASSQENVNNMTAASNLQTYLKDLQEQNSILSWLTNNGASVAEAMAIIGNGTLFAGAQAAKANGEFDEFMETAKEALSIETTLRGPGTSQKSPFQQAIESLKEERKQLRETSSAYNKLRQQGFSITQAFDLAKDPVLATAVATTKVGTQKWEKLVDLLKQVDTLSRKNAIKDLVASRAATNNLNSAFIGVAKTLSEMGYDLEDIKEIMNDPNLMAAFIEDLKDGVLDAKLLRDYLNQIDIEKKIEVEIELTTPEGIENQFMDIYDKAMEGFAVRRERVEDDFEDQIRSTEKAIEATNDEIEQVERQIESIETTIADKQREIEINITRPIEAFQEEIADLQRQIELQFTRPIAELQEESSDLANDLTLMDKEVEDINKKYDDQLEALESISQINERIANQQQAQLDIADALSRGDIAAAARAAQQMREQEAAARDQAARDAIEEARQRELESLRSPSGLTRDEIEQRQFEISQAIFNLEEEREKVQKRIQDIQDDIYDLEELRESKLREIRDLEDQIYDIQVDQLRPLRDKLRDQEDMLDKLNDEKNARLEAIRLEEEVWNDTKLAFDEAMQRGMDYIAMLREAARLLGLLNGEIDNQFADNPFLDAEGNVKEGSFTVTPENFDQLPQEEQDFINDWLGDESPGNQSSGDSSGSSSSEGASSTTSSGSNTSVYQAQGVTVTNRDKAAAAAVGAVKSGAASDPLSFANSVRETVLANRDAVRSGNLSAAEKNRLTKENINLMNSTGLKFAMGGMVKKLMGGGLAAKASRASGVPSQASGSGSVGYLRMGGMIPYKRMGGLMPYMSLGGMFKSVNTDTIPAMLSAGEFVVRRSAVDKYGETMLKSVNNGTYNGESVYNYNLSVNVKSDSNPDDIARVVMTKIKQVDSQRMRSNRF